MKAVIIGDVGWMPDSVRAAIEETATNFEIVVVFGDPARRGADALLTVGQARANHPDAWIVAVVLPTAMHDALIAGANEVVSPRASVEEVKARLQRRLIYERTPEQAIGLPLPASARRLMTLGKVSTGLAHDFNNLLTVIMGNAAFLKEEADFDASSQRLIRGLELSAMRASSLTEQILRYAGGVDGRLQSVDLNLVVKDTVPFLQALVTPTAELQLDLADTLVEVRADRGGLHQLLVDLVQNAVEASDEIGSPVVVRTGVDKVSTGQNLQPRDTLVGRDAVFLEVEDRGHGMNSATVGQAFDPFFSTRGYGRGLGLSVVREVARSHSGAIEVDSQLGRGTRIRVWLPFGRAPKRRSVSSSAERSASRGVVLVADDEPEVRGLLRRILVAGGYQVLEAGDGASTLELVDAHPESRLLILDLTMPRMDGAEVARRLVIRHRTLPVMMMSGYALSKAKTLLAGVEVAGFLKKPFLPGAVLSKVKRILGE